MNSSSPPLYRLHWLEIYLTPNPNIRQIRKAYFGMHLQVLKFWVQHLASLTTLHPELAADYWPNLVKLSQQMYIFASRTSPSYECASGDGSGPGPASRAADHEKSRAVIFGALVPRLIGALQAGLEVVPSRTQEPSTFIQVCSHSLRIQGTAIPYKLKTDHIECFSAVCMSMYQRDYPSIAD